jgi:hypothetical protein
MRLTRSQIDTAKQRGAVVVADGKSKAKTKSVEPVTSFADSFAERSAEAILTNSAATLVAVEQVKLLAESINSAMQRKVPDHPAYRFTVERDKDGRMSEIVAQPVEPKL